MWVSEEKATGEMSYTWQAPGHGDWALLLSSDGKAPAPTNISMTVDNEAGTPWAVPLMVIGSALLALAALLFLFAPRTPKGAAAAVGRRAAGRRPPTPQRAPSRLKRLSPPAGAPLRRLLRPRSPKPAGPPRTTPASPVPRRPPARPRPPSPPTPPRHCPAPCGAPGRPQPPPATADADASETGDAGKDDSKGRWQGRLQGQGRHG